MQNKVPWLCGFKCTHPFGLHSCMALEGGSHIYPLLLIFPLHCLDSFACWLVPALYLPRHSCSWWSPLSAIWSLQEVKHLPTKPLGLSTTHQELRLASAQQPRRICVLLVLSFHAAARSAPESKAPASSGEQDKAGHPPRLDEPQPGPWAASRWRNPEKKGWAVTKHSIKAVSPRQGPEATMKPWGSVVAPHLVPSADVPTVSWLFSCDPPSSHAVTDQFSLPLVGVSYFSLRSYKTGTNWRYFWCPVGTPY